MCLLGQTGNTELIYKAELYTKEAGPKSKPNGDGDGRDG